MNKFIILSENAEYEYTLIIRLTDKGKPVDCQPYVVAWRYDFVTKSWAQGHYFQTLEAAIIYMYFKDKCEDIYQVILDMKEAPFD